MNFQVIDGPQSGSVGSFIKAFPWQTLPDCETLIVLEFEKRQREVFHAKELHPSTAPMTRLALLQPKPSIPEWGTVTCVTCGTQVEIEAGRIKQRGNRPYRCSKCANSRARGKIIHKACPIAPAELIKRYETTSLHKLAVEFHVGQRRVRQWVIDAGGTIRLDKKGKRPHVLSNK